MATLLQQARHARSANDQTHRPLTLVDAADVAQ
jgi:hypothetical protein